MANLIRIKRGLRKDLTDLQLGEPAVTTDTNEFFIGVNENVKIPNYNEVVDIANSGIKRLKYKTVSITFDNEKSEAETKRQIEEIKEVATGVVICPLVNITTATSTNFTMYNEANFNKYINMVVDAGLEIAMIKPHIVLNWKDDFYRPTYNPNITDFFANWLPVLRAYAQKCVQYDVPYLCVSCEQQNQTMAENTQSWKTLLSTLRNEFPNLKYISSMTTGELYSLWYYYIPQRRENLADFLDAIGSNSYIKLTDKTYNPSAPNIHLEELQEAWFYSIENDSHIENLQKISAYYKKPIIITEVGCMPRVDGLISVVATGEINYTVQALYYESMLTTLGNCDFVEGVSIWNVQAPFNFSNGDGNLTASGKVLKKYFKEVM